VSSVFDPGGAAHFYDVAFDRSLKGCVVLAAPGTGTPSGTPNFKMVTSFPVITISPAANPAVARVQFFTQAGLQTDTSFMIAAFC
jgi:hypothetical protein